MERINIDVVNNPDLSIAYDCGCLAVYGVGEDSFNELKKQGYYDKRDDTEWVVVAGVTFFKK